MSALRATNPSKIMIRAILILFIESSDMYYNCAYYGFQSAREFGVLQQTDG